jgi:hypothetical protein
MRVADEQDKSDDSDEYTRFDACCHQYFDKLFRYGRRHCNSPQKSD